MEIQWIFALILVIVLAIIMMPIYVWGIIDTTKAIIQNIRDIRKSLGEMPEK